LLRRVADAAFGEGEHAEPKAAMARLGAQVVELLAALAREAGRRHIEIASKIERHRSVQYAAHGREVTIGVGVPDPLEHLVDRVGVGEDVVRGLPVGVFVGIAEARYPERPAVSERSAKVRRSGARGPKPTPCSTTFAS